MANTHRTKFIVPADKIGDRDFALAPHTRIPWDAIKQTFAGHSDIAVGVSGLIVCNECRYGIIGYLNNEWEPVVLKHVECTNWKPRWEAARGETA